MIIRDKEQYLRANERREDDHETHIPDRIRMNAYFPGVPARDPDSGDECRREHETICVDSNRAQIKDLGIHWELLFLLRLFFCGVLDNFLGNVRRDFIVVGKLHMVASSSSGNGGENRRIANHFGHWHLSFNDLNIPLYVEKIIDTVINYFSYCLVSSFFAKLYVCRFIHSSYTQHPAAACDHVVAVEGRTRVEHFLVVTEVLVEPCDSLAFFITAFI